MAANDFKTAEAEIATLLPSVVKRYNYISTSLSWEAENKDVAGGAKRSYVLASPLFSDDPEFVFNVWHADGGRVVTSNGSGDNWIICVKNNWIIYAV